MNPSHAHAEDDAVPPPPLTLVPGDAPVQIGPYDVTRELGRGGMGVVYHARDPRLNRSVAIKAVSQSFVRDPERLARFEREGRLLASLDHPNVAGIHGVEEVDGRRYLILEYVDGETLAERLTRGPLALEDALDLCHQVALALEAAHDHQVIHRDLKPGNIKIRSDGQVKVLDFGLAKGRVEAARDTAESPTVTFAATSPGMVIGTASYMSPEQARGREVDRRADVWAFGCLLYECLSGRRAFQGETPTDTLAMILGQDPDWNALPALPPRVRHLLHRCLAKDARRRMRDMGDVRLELEEALEQVRGGSGSLAPASGGWIAPRRGRWRDALAAAPTALAGLVAGVLLCVPQGWRLAHPHPTRLSVVAPASVHVASAQLTPDGSRVVLTAKPVSTPDEDEPLPRVYVRPLDAFELQPVAGTAGIIGVPIVSRDSRWLWFIAPASPQSSERKLFRAPLDGSDPPMAVTDWAHNWNGLAELGNGDLVVVSDLGHSFHVIASHTGQVGPRRDIDAGAYTGRFEAGFGTSAYGPMGLLLSAIAYGPRGWVVSVVALDCATGRAHAVVDEGGSPALTADHRLLFTRGDALLGARFDAGRGAVVGTPVALASGLRTLGACWPAAFSLSHDGTLLFGPGGRVGEQRHLVRVDGPGSASSLTSDHQAFQPFVVMSSDGRRIAVSATNARGLDEVWVLDPGQPALRKVVTLPADCDWPLWSPDRHHLAFTRMGNDRDDGIYEVDVDRADPPHRVLSYDGAKGTLWASSWSPDGATLLLTWTGASGSDLWVANLHPDGSAAGPARPLIATGASELQGSFSPDGRWIAYSSDISGKDEVYVRTFGPGGTLGPAFQVTRERATYPRWMSGNRLVYYDELTESGMVEPLSLGATVSAGAPQLLVANRSLRVPGFNIATNGAVVAVQRSVEEDDSERYDVVLHALDDMHSRMAARP